MGQFELNILGCGAALSTIKHSLSSQVVNFCEELYMIDCGEGSQLQFRAMKLEPYRLNHIFISHLHGDHCFGLFGLISMFGLLGRTTDLCIYSHPDAKYLFQPLIKYFCKELPFRIVFYSFNPTCNELIFENNTLKVSTIPLKHRVPTVGFLFEEKPQKLNLAQETIDFHEATDLTSNIKKDHSVSTDDQIISSPRSLKLTDFSRKYAYCSDTAYCENIISLIAGVDLLYHEATFSNKDLIRAEKTYHSSAQQASLIAKAANVKKLILGHFSSRYSDEISLLKEAQEIFPNTILANEQIVLPIN